VADLRSFAKKRTAKVFVVVDGDSANKQLIKQVHVCACQIKYKLVGENAKSPGEALCCTATEEKADMIVIGSRGLGAIKRAMVGSVSEYVVRNSGLPCIIVHKKHLVSRSGASSAAPRSAASSSL